MRRLLSFLSLLSVGLSSCVSDGSRSDARDLVVFAAASLTDVFRLVEPTAGFNFAGSDQLATQIREGARADVYAAASPAYPARLRNEGLVEEPVRFATNRLVLIVPRSNPARIDAVEDLGHPGVKLVVGAPSVPVGDYTRKVLAALGAAEVLERVVSEEQDVRGVIGKVALGEADAGFVYATDVASAGDKVRAIVLASGVQPGVSYMIAVCASAPHPDAARAFVAKLLGAEGRRALADAGFGLP